MQARCSVSSDCGCPEHAIDVTLPTSAMEGEVSRGAESSCLRSVHPYALRKTTKLPGHVRSQARAGCAMVDPTASLPMSEAVRSGVYAGIRIPDRQPVRGP
jgi:hypothetical protein